MAQPPSDVRPVSQCARKRHPPAAPHLARGPDCLTHTLTNACCSLSRPPVIAAPRGTRISTNKILPDPSTSAYSLSTPRVLLAPSILNVPLPEHIAHPPSGTTTGSKTVRSVVRDRPTWARGELLPSFTLRADVTMLVERGPARTCAMPFCSSVVRSRCRRQMAQGIRTISGWVP